MEELSDSQLKAELEDIMNRINGIMQKVEGLMESPEEKQPEQGELPPAR